jgi:hypothetical protein
VLKYVRAAFLSEVGKRKSFRRFQRDPVCQQSIFRPVNLIMKDSEPHRVSQLSCFRLMKLGERTEKVDTVDDTPPGLVFSCQLSLFSVNVADASITFPAPFSTSNISDEVGISQQFLTSQCASENGKSKIVPGS